MVELHASSHFTPGKVPLYPPNTRLGETQTRCGRFGEKKSLAPSGIRTADRLAYSVLNWLALKNSGFVHAKKGTGTGGVHCGGPFEPAVTTSNVEHRVSMNNDQSVMPCRAILTYLLTPWCRVLLENLTGLQLVKKFPAISRNPKVHYRTQKRPPPVSILDQPNPVHIPTSHLLEIHPNIIHPSTPRSPQWFFPSGFPTKTPYTPLSSPYAPHVQPISFFSILSPAQYWVRSTNNLAPHYAFSSIPPLPRPS